MKKKRKETHKHTHTHIHTRKYNSKKAVNKQKQFHLNLMDHFQQNSYVLCCVQYCNINAGTNASSATATDA